MDFEQMQKIVDGAPEWAFGYCQSLSVYTASAGSNAKHLNITSLDSMRDQLAKRDLLKLEAIICDGDKISDEARELIKDGFVGSIPTMKTVIDGLNKEKSIQILDLRSVDIPHGTIVLEK